MIRSPSDVIAYARSSEGRKLMKYTAVSGISVVVGEVSLLVLLLIGLSPAFANLGQAAIATVPSYELNRKWAWGRSGKGHLWKEVVPFWALSFVGLGFSELTAIAAGNYGTSHHWTKGGRAVLVDIVVLLTYGVLWIGKFIVFNKVLFAHHEQDLAPALDGRTGLPT